MRCQERSLTVSTGVNQEPREGLCFPEVRLRDDGFEVVGVGGEFGGRERTCGLVRRLEREAYAIAFRVTKT